MTPKIKAMVNSYGRALFVAVFTVYMTNPDGKFLDIIKAGVIAFAAPIIRALDKNDNQFGVGSQE